MAFASSVLAVTVHESRIQMKNKLYSYSYSHIMGERMNKSGRCLSFCFRLTFWNVVVQVVFCNNARRCKSDSPFICSMFSFKPLRFFSFEIQLCSTITEFNGGNKLPFSIQCNGKMYSGNCFGFKFSPLKFACRNGGARFANENERNSMEHLMIKCDNEPCPLSLKLRQLQTAWAVEWCRTYYMCRCWNNDEHFRINYIFPVI